MRGITSVNTLAVLLWRVESFFVNMGTPVCMQIVHVQTCSSLNEVQQHVVRGSIGLADWILKEQTHLLHRVRTSH